MSCLIKFYDYLKDNSRQLFTDYNIIKKITKTLKATNTTEFLHHVYQFVKIKFAANFFLAGHQIKVFSHFGLQNSI